MEKDAGQALQHQVRSETARQSRSRHPTPHSIQATLNANRTFIKLLNDKLFMRQQMLLFLFIHFNHVTKRANKVYTHVTKRANKVYNALPILQHLKSCKIRPIHFAVASPATDDDNSLVSTTAAKIPAPRIPPSLFSSKTTRRCSVSCKPATPKGPCCARFTLAAEAGQGC